MMASEDFAIGKDGLTKDGYRALDKRARTSMYVRSVIILAASLTIYVILVIFHGEAGWDRVFMLPVSMVMTILAVYLLISPAIYYARYRYRIEGDRIDIRRGIIFIHHEIVPVERIHQIEVFQGPVDNLFSLANVTITTAGGVAHIQHLERSAAEDIADSLNEQINKIIRERD